MILKMMKNAKLLIFLKKITIKINQYTIFLKKLTLCEMSGESAKCMSFFELVILLHCANILLRLYFNN